MAAVSPSPVLLVDRLGFAYPGQTPLFDGVSFAVPPGVTLLQGDMSSGKTTLLRLMAGELGGSGRRRLGGLLLEDDPAAYRRAVCWFDPRDAAFDAMKPRDLLAALRLQWPTIDEAGWRDHAEAFGLTPHLDKPLYALSTGSRRKAALAVALSSGCALTLLDEPAGGLDGPSLAHLRQTLGRAAGSRDRAVVLVCSHGLEDLAVTHTLTLPLG